MMIMNIYLINVVSDHDNAFKINFYQKFLNGGGWAVGFLVMDPMVEFCFT